MPNWACGSVAVTGTRQNISRFVSRFLFEDKPKPDSKRRDFFARSFTWCLKEEAMLNIRILFQNRSKAAVDTFCMPIAFAWSAHSCLMDGYPQSFPECITLMDACVRDCVSVEILTEEGGMGFEVHITCDEQGAVESASMDLVEYECQHCHDISCIASFNDLDEYPCNECGESKWKRLCRKNDGATPIKEESKNE